MIECKIDSLSNILPYLQVNKNLKDKKYLLQFLPESLLKISSEKQILFNNRRLKPSYIIDIIHGLILKYYFKKENRFNLMSTILKEKYGYLYNYYIEFLIKNGFIILLKNHQKGKTSRVYAISESILRGKIVRYTNYDKVIVKKYKNKISDIEEDLSPTPLIDRDVKCKLVNDLFSVEVQFDRSIFYLDSLKENDIDIYNRNKYSVECISDKHIFYHFDSFGRMHTNFTILKSFIRKNCLLIDGEETKECDLHNSQPLFLTKLISDSNSKWVDMNEFNLFKFLTINGKYYQYLIDNTDISSKKEAKELTYKVLFGRNNPNSKNDKDFSRLFPTIHNFIKLYKKEFNNYKILSHDLQKAESNLIFNKIIKKIVMDYPEIKVITIHDSILYPIRYDSIIKDIFHNMVKEEFNF